MTQNKFLLRILAFIAILILFVYCLWRIVTWTRDDLCRNEQATTLVLGNSRVQYGFDDSIIPGTWNSAVNADNYNVIFWRLKMLHKRNPQLKRIMVICDQTQVYNYFKGIPDKIHPYYWDVMTLEDWWRLITHDSGILLNPLHYLKIIMPLKSLLIPISYQDLGIGGYTRLERDKLSEDLERNNNNTLLAPPHHNEYNISYLEKIVSYCSANKLQLILFNMPSYPTKSVIEGNTYLHNFIIEHYPNIPFMDYELTELADSCYGDISHLNYKGAKIISHKIAEDLSDF